MMDVLEKVMKHGERSSHLNRGGVHGADTCGTPITLTKSLRPLDLCLPPFEVEERVPIHTGITQTGHNVPDPMLINPTPIFLGEFFWPNFRKLFTEFQPTKSCR